MRTLISADIGTTAVKLSLVNIEGVLLRSSSEEYPLKTDGWKVEQDPELWWKAFTAALKNILPLENGMKPEAIVLSGQMQDLIPIQGDQCSGNAILYSDTRARNEFSTFSRDLDEKSLIVSTANLSSPSNLPAKILWYQKNMDKDNPFFLLGAHDYISWKLSGAGVTDYTNAATTGLLDFDSNSWNNEILSYLNITEKNLPKLVSASEITGSITSKSAGETGLPRGLPVIHGSGDAGSSTIGTGAGEEGIISCYLGTSGWIAATGNCRVNPETGIFNLRHPDPEKIMNIGPMMMTGGNVDWTARTFLDDTDFEKFTRTATLSPPGANGVFYLPHLTGERSPFMDPDARGGFIGIEKGSGKPEMFRAVLEGVSYSLSSILNKIFPEKSDIEEIRLSGGGARNTLWAKILASITGSRIKVLENADETGVIGNTVIGGKALGWFDSFALPEGFLKIKAEHEPVEEWIHVYQKGKEIFDELYPSLRNTYRKIAEWQN